MTVEIEAHDIGLEETQRPFTDRLFYSLNNGNFDGPTAVIGSKFVICPVSIKKTFLDSGEEVTTPIFRFEAHNSTRIVRERALKKNPNETKPSQKDDEIGGITLEMDSPVYIGEQFKVSHVSQGGSCIMVLIKSTKAFDTTKFPKIPPNLKALLKPLPKTA